MKRNRKLFIVALTALCVLLAVAVAIFIFKQREYALSAEYYSSLRMGS